MQGIKKRKNVAARMVEAFKKGSPATKTSFFLMGSGQIMRRQYIKGALYCLTQIAFILFLIFFGGRYLIALFSGNLGTRVSGTIWNEQLQIFEKIRGDNSFLILLYGVISIVVFILFTVVWMMNVFGSYETDMRLAAGKKPTSFKEDLSVLFGSRFYIPLLILPFVGVLVFTILPLVFMVLIAFTNYDYAHMPPGRLFDWVGLENFRNLFSLSGGTSGFALVFLRVLLWTFVWAFFATFSNYFLGLIVALMINRKSIRFKGVFRTMFVLAIAIPQFVTLLLMQKILDGDGILNVLLGTRILWLTDQTNFALLPRLMIILVNTWIGMPYTLLMTSGVLLNIPADYYEAARIDGASPVKIFIHVVLPYTLHVTTPYLITQFVGNINNFNVIWLLTGGGPVDNVYYGGGTQAQSTDLLVTWLYRLTTDRNPRYNVASVIGIVIFVLSAAFSLIAYNQSASVKREEEFQ